MGRKRLDLAGKKFGKWTVIEFSHMAHNSYWLCRCECGNESAVLGSALTNGKSSCCSDCNPGNTKHGMHNSPENKIWKWMKRRCYYPEAPDYPRYGGRGIYVCDRWKDSFENFYEDMGPRPSKKHSLDRIDNDGPYSPDNCRWTTAKKQANNRENNLNLTYKGKTQTVAQWAREVGISENTIRDRILYRKWDTESALTMQPYESSIRFITFNNQTKSLNEWAEDLGMKPDTLSNRIDKLGWTIERALTEPLNKNMSRSQSWRHSHNAPDD